MNDDVLAIALAPNGSVVAGGWFTTAGGVAANRIARWDGATWSPLGGGCDAYVRAILVTPTGDVIAGGNFTTAATVVVNRIARWNGIGWSSLGAGFNGTVWALCRLADGSIVAGGTFTTSGATIVRRVARWNGSVWSPMGAGLDGTVRRLQVLPNGTLIAAGDFLSSGADDVRRLARWNGTAWVQFASDPGTLVHDVQLLPDGDVLASCAPGLVAVQRWNGVSWSPVATAPNGPIYDLAAMADGSILAGGSYTRIDELAAGYLARLEPTCPAGSVTFAGGCPSSGGANTLQVTSLPFLESTFRTRATGLPLHAWVVTVTGFSTLSPATRLDTFAPLGVPGCELHVMGDILEMKETTNGTLDWQIAVPPFPPIVGMHFYHQMVPIEVDAQQQQISLTSTNALQLTAGQF